MSLSRPNFFSKGVTLAILKEKGKQPWKIERLAREDMRCEKTEEQDLMREVGIKSWRENFEEEVERSFTTSSAVQGGKVDIEVPVNGASGTGVGEPREKSLA